MNEQFQREVPELLPARMLNEYTYCPRLFYLEWVDMEWAPSHDTVVGEGVHKRVDKARGSFERAGDRPDAEITSLTLSSEDEGLTARLDMVERDGDAWIPVDYKKGSVPPNGTPWEADRIQVGVQALLLRCAGKRCEQAVVYYAASKRRISINVDDSLVDDVRRAARQAREAASLRTPPPPLVDSPKCARCSLVGICLPDETNQSASTDAELVQPPARPVRATDSPALPVYVSTPGTRIGKSGETLVATTPDGETAKIRLIDVSQLCLMGNISVSASVISELMARDIPICHFSGGGWFHGVTHSVGSRNAGLRISQFEVAADESRSLNVARGLVARKILNQRTVLRRNHEDAPKRTLEEMKALSTKALSAESPGQLLGLEGLAARAYFGQFAGMLRPNVRDWAEFHESGRNRRPPLDPVNALLSFAYSILAKDWTTTLFTVGLDPFVGVFHRPRFGRASLALDLMEEFRPLVADSVVLQLLNNGEVGPTSFVMRGGACALTPDGRRSFFQAWERRLSHEVTHPVFRYAISYRRLFEVQSRLFARALTGELDRYEGFTTR
ncbi:MAG: CRISPR-associated endonuclease Cas1 [Planctomycetota bacterium]